MLIDLPEELLLNILGYLDEQAIVRLTSTCQALLTIARSDEAWRDRVEKLVNAHARTPHARSKSTTDEQVGRCLRWKPNDGLYHRYVQGNLDTTARFCGWWASTQAYRGRLLRVSLHVHDDGTLSTVGEEVSVVNAFAADRLTGHRSTRWKPRSAIWSGRGLSYRIPQNHPSVDAGYSVDILDPILQYTPLFRFTPSTGFALFSSVTGVLASSIPIDLALRTHFRRKLRDTSGSSGMYGDLSSYSQIVPPAFPSRDAVKAGLVRDLSIWQRPVTDKASSIVLQGDYLTAPTFTLQPRRLPHLKGDANGNEAFPHAVAGASSLSPVTSATGVNYITQPRPIGPPAAAAQTALIRAPHGGSQLLRIIMQGIGTILPAAFQETLLSEEGAEDEDEEVFYPVQGPLRDSFGPKLPPLQKCTAASLRGLWVGTYSTHGYELGIISIRYIWTKIHLADEIELEQIYEDDSSTDEATNTMPMFAREPLQVNLEGSIRRRRAIIEFVKLTGDANVPAGQVSWVAILPTPLLDAATLIAHAGDEESLWDVQLKHTLSLSDIEVPTVLRSDWEAWSDCSENVIPRTAVSPRWNEGTIKAAGRIAMAGFMDTRFIGAEATFVRETSGQVDEIRVKWYVSSNTCTDERGSLRLPLCFLSNISNLGPKWWGQKHRKGSDNADLDDRRKCLASDGAISTSVRVTALAAQNGWPPALFVSTLY